MSHLVYVEGEGVPVVEREELGSWGVECVRVYGRREGGVVRYDGKGLAAAVGAILGRGRRAGGRRSTGEM